MMLASILAALAGVALLFQAGTTALAAARLRRAMPPPAAVPMPRIAVLRPVRGLENALAATLATTFDLEYPNCEAVFCIETPADPAVPLVEALMAERPAFPARLLVGASPVSVNPKLNNLVKGWEATGSDLVLMVDSNVLMPAGFIGPLLARMTPDTAVVSAPAEGVMPEGFGGELECAFLNSCQARIVLAADSVGLGFAMGKSMLWRREVLDGAGGITALGSEVAEDIASTKVARAAGCRVRLARRPVPHPVGRRSFGEVWRRQVRWAMLRRVGLPATFLPEPLLVGIVPPAIAVALAGAGVVPGGVALAYLVLWYACDAALSLAAGWPIRRATLFAWIARDLLIPAIWAVGLAGRRFEWRGNAMSVTPEPTRERPAQRTPATPPA